MSKVPIADAVVFVFDAALQETLKDELKKKEVSHVAVATDLADCLDHLERLPRALFVVDWSFGAPDVVRALEVAQSKEQGQVRPFLLLAPELTPEIVATAAEYGVSHIHTGDWADARLVTSLGMVIRGEAACSEFRESLGQAIRARGKGKLELAQTILERLRKDHPQEPRLQAELAETLIEDGLFDDALAELRSFESSHPPNLRGLHLLGRCLMKKGRFDEAVQVFNRANLLNPHNVDRLVDLGQALLRLDRVDDAKGAFDAALTLDPDAHAATVGKGQCLLLEGEVNEALGLMREVTSPTELASLFNTAAIVSMRHERFHSGMSLYRAAIRAVGSDDRIHARLMVNMGLGYRRWRRLDQAATCFERASELDPSYERARELKDGTRPEGADDEASEEGLFETTSVVY